MKLMLEVAYNYLRANKEASLSAVFDNVKKELENHWKNSFPGVTMEKIEEQKLGELYTYLTTDGRFVMLEKNVWTINATLTSQQLLSAKSKVVIDSTIEEEIQPIDDDNDVPYNGSDPETLDNIDATEEIDIAQEASINS